MVRVVLCMAAFLAFCLLTAPAARADVVGEQIVVGDVRFVRQGDQVFIYAGNGSIINYQAFSIDANELVQFFQPGADSTVLNRILGPSPTTIDGTLLANGRVYFANPAGVIFGPNSIINVGGIYAAAAQITDTDFLNGVNQFNNATGSVVNYGTIQAQAVHLIGRHVANHGSIVAPSGLVTLLAGNSAFIGEVGGNLLVRVDGRDVTGNALPSAGGTTPDLAGDAGVLNTGSITAGGGNLVLGAGDLYSLGIHNTGSLRADGGNVTVQAHDGAIYNEGEIRADTAVSGSGLAPRDASGTVIVRGPTVVNSGVIAADALAGQAGFVEVTSNNHTYLLVDSVVSASGIGEVALGGEVLINSYNGLTFFSERSLVDVSGGESSGEAGFAEVSGERLRFFGDMDFTGGGGTLLIDPEILTIVDSAGADDNTLLGADGIVSFDEDPGQPNSPDAIIEAGRIEFIAGLDGTPTDIMLEAELDIIIEFGFDMQGQNITLNAGRDIVFEAAVINANSIFATADADFSGIGGDPSDGEGDITINSGINLSVVDQLVLNGINITFGGNLTSTGVAGMIMFNGDAATTGGLRTVTASQVFLTGDTMANNGLSFVGDVFLTGIGNQLVDGGTGQLSFSNLVSKTSVGDLTLDSALDAANAISVGGDALTNFGTLHVDGQATAAGDLTAGGTGALDINEDLVLSGAGTQTLAAGDAITAEGDITKAAGDLDINGNLDLDGAGTQVLAAAGGISADGDITKGAGLLDINSTLTLDGAGTQILASGGGINAVGDITKAAGILDLNSDLTLDGAVLQTVSAGGGVLAAGDLIKTTGNLTIGNAITFDGIGDQAVNAGGDLSFMISVDKTTSGNLDLAGNNITFDAVVTAMDGLTAVANDALTVNANLSAGTLIDLQSGADDTGDLTFGAGVTLSADSISLRAGDGQNLGDLNLAVVNFTNSPDFLGTGGAGTSPDAFTWRQDASIFNFFSGPLAGDFGGGLAGLDYTIRSDAGNLVIDDSARVAGSDLSLIASGTNALLVINPDLLNMAGVSAQANGAGGLVDVNGSLSASGAIALSSAAGNTVAGNLTSTAGNLTLGGSTAFDGVGNQVASAVAIDANGNVVKNTLGNFTLTGSGTSTYAGAFVQATGGNLILNGAVNFDGAGNQLAIASGIVDLNATTRKITGGNLTFQSGAGTLNVAGALVEATGGNLVFNTAVNFDGVGNQTALASGAIDANGNVRKSTAGQMVLNGAGGVFLAGATTDTSNGNIIVDGNITFDGFGNQAATASNGVLTFLDAANKTTLGSLDIAGGSLNVAAVDVDFGNLRFSGLTNGTGNIIASGNVTFDSIAFVVGNVTASAGQVQFDGTSNITGNVNAGTNAVFGNGAGDNATVTGAIAAGAGDITFAANATLGGNATATGGDLIFNGNATFNGAGAQTAHADGVITALGSVTKTTNNLLTLDADNTGLLATAITLGDGAGVDTVSSVGSLAVSAAAGNIDVAQNVTTTNGSATFSGNAFIGGNVVAGGSATFMNNVTFDAVAAAQTVTAGDDVSIAGTALRDNAANDADLTISAGDLMSLNTISADRTLTINGLNIELDGNATAMAGDLTFNGELILTGLAVQTLTAGDELSLGEVSKAASNLVLAGANGILLGDDLTVSAGNLTVMDALTVSGNGHITTTGAQTYNDAITLNDDTVMDAGAGTIVFNSTIDGAADLVTTSSGTIMFRDDVGGGTALTSLTTNGGGTTQFGGNGAVTTTTTGDQDHDNAVTLLDDITATAGGEVNFLDGVSGPFALTVSTPDSFAVGSNINVGSLDINADSGIAITAANVDTTGGQRYRDAVTLTGDVTMTSSGGGDIAFDSTVGGAQDLAVNTAGRTVFGANVNIASLTTDTPGLTVVNGSSVQTSGTQVYGDNVALNQNTTFTSTGSTLAFNNGVSGAGFDLTADADGVTTLRGIVDLDALSVLDNANLAATITTTGDMTFGDDIFLIGDTSLSDFSADGFSLDVNITGNNDLAIFGDNGVVINGMLGTPGSRLASVSLDTGDALTSASVVDGVAAVLQLNIPGIYTVGDILLNFSGRDTVPADATIVVGSATTPMDIELDSLTGGVGMGRREKLTVFGDLFINAFAVALGDVTSLGDMHVTASSGLIFFRGRESGQVRDTFGNLVNEFDNGVDFVTGGQFFFSHAPTAFPGEAGFAAFGSQGGGGDALGTLGGFIQQAFADPLTADDLIVNPGLGLGNIVLDLKADGPSNTNVSEALAGALPRETELEEVPQETPVGSAELDTLRRLGINARRLIESEYIRNLTLPAAVFNDSKSYLNELYQIENMVTDKRLFNERVPGVARKYEAMIGVTEEGQPGRREQIANLLSAARGDFARENPGRELTPAAFRTFLRDARYQDARLYFEQLDDLFADIRLLGLTKREYQNVENTLLRDIESTFIDVDFLRQMLTHEESMPADEE